MIPFKAQNAVTRFFFQRGSRNETRNPQADKELRDANEEMIAEKEMQLRNMKAQPPTGPTENCWKNLFNQPAG